MIVALNIFLMKVEEPIEESRVHQHPAPPVGGCVPLMSLQVADFSPVITNFHDFSAFFTPFLSHKGLISRRLQQNGGLIKSHIQHTESNLVRSHKVLKDGRWNLNLANACRL
jgi:hypothetical protein